MLIKCFLMGAIFQSLRENAMLEMHFIPGQGETGFAKSLAKKPALFVCWDRSECRG
jgi:hypothetical protein